MATSILTLESTSRKLYVKVVVGLALLVLGLGYIYFLNVEDKNAVANLSRLHHSDRMDYLENVRHHKGFRAYVAKYRKSFGYEHFNRDVPVFLLGRWALFDRPQRVGYEYIAEDCSRFLAIEDGEIKAVNKKETDYRARFRIAQAATQPRVQADVGGGTILPISLVSFGMDLHHIVVRLPGHKKQQYGYLCE